MYYSVYEVGRKISKEEFLRQRSSAAGWVHNCKLVNHILAGAYSSIVPMHIEVCSTYLCNFNCPWCSCAQARSDNLHKKQSLTREELYRIIDDCSRNDIGIQWTGGEPLANPNTIGAIEVASQRNVNQCLFSNGSLLTRDISKRILQTNLAFIRISLNCATPKVHCKFHGGISESLSGITLANIDALCQEKYRSNSKVQLGISIVVDSTNAGDLEQTFMQIMQWARKYPNALSYIVLRPVNDDFEGIITKKQASFTDIYQSFINSRFIEEVRSLGVKIILPYKDQMDYRLSRHPLGCMTFSELAPDGSMFLCSDKYGAKDYCIGNVLLNSISSVLNSQQCRNVREKHKECFSCGQCPHYSRGWYFNMIFDQVESLRAEGKIDIVANWICELQKIIPNEGHSFFI